MDLTTDADAFEAAIAAAPDDEAPRLVYADWLLEPGDQEASDRQRQLATLRDQIEAFAEHVSTVADQKHIAQFLSGKWCRIASVDETGRPVRAYGFVCLEDNETKALGRVEAGDIHFADGWKKPAKHPRGSVFERDSWGCAEKYGIAYLRRNRWSRRTAEGVLV